MNCQGLGSYLIFILNKCICGLRREGLKESMGICLIQRRLQTRRRDLKRICSVFYGLKGDFAICNTATYQRIRMIAV